MNSLYYHMRFKRNRNWGFTNFLLPTILLCFLVILVFLLPPESGEKMGLDITTFLTLMVANQLVADQTPPGSQSPLIINFFMHAMILNALSLIMSIIVLRMHHYEPCVQRPMSTWQRYIFLQVMPAVFRVPPPGCETPTSIFEGATWRFLKMPDSDMNDLDKGIRRNSINSIGTIEEMTNYEGVIGLNAGKRDTEMSEREVLVAMKQLVADTLATVKKINRKTNESDFASDERIIGAREDWMFGAFIVDRCLLVVFLIYLCVIVIVYGIPLMLDSILKT